jgi:hypothetical protein
MRPFSNLLIVDVAVVFKEFLFFAKNPASLSNKSVGLGRTNGSPDSSIFFEGLNEGEK